MDTFNTYLAQIDAILSRPTRELYVRTWPDFVSYTLRRNWDSFVHSRDTLESWKNYYWRIVKLCAQRDSTFREFLEKWILLCRDHSSTDAAIDFSQIINVKSHGIADFNGMTRLYYLPTGISALPASPNDQENPNLNTVYKAAESHKLQNDLIKYCKGKHTTVKVYEQRSPFTKIIYYNKSDKKTVEFLQIHALAESWENFLKHQTDLPPVDAFKDISNILKHFKTCTTVNPEFMQIPFSELPNNRKVVLKHAIFAVKTDLDLLEEHTVKNFCKEGDVTSFANDWCTRLESIEIKRVENDIKKYNDHTEHLVKEYSRVRELIRTQQSILHALLSQNNDATFLKNFFTFFSEMPGTLFKIQLNSLFALVEVPFSHTHTDRIEESIDDIPDDLTPDYGIASISSVFGLDVLKVVRNGCFKQVFYTGFRDKCSLDDFYKCFIKATKKALKNIFVNKTVRMYLTSCLHWSKDSSEYSPNGIKIRDLPEPFQEYGSTRVWNPHITFYNCWGAGRSETARALADRDPQTAFEYTVASLGQISFPETAGNLIAAIIWGRYQNHGQSDFEKAMYDVRAYQREGEENRITLRDLILGYIAEEMPEELPAEENNEEIEETLVEQSETSDTAEAVDDITARLEWLNEHAIGVRFDTQGNPDIELTDETERTEYYVSGTRCVYLTSGDFLTPDRYEEYLTLFPTGPRSSRPTHVRPAQPVDDTEETAEEPCSHDLIENTPHAATPELINLVNRDGVWMFPSRDLMPERYQALENIALERIPNLDDIQEVFYDTVEDHVYYMQEQTKHILYEDITGEYLS